MMFVTGCEINLTNDAKNCGSCGKACAFGESCVNTVCKKDNVLVIGTNGTAMGVVQAALQGTAVFATVDVFLASGGTPGALFLQQGYQAVLVFSDGNFMDPAGLGNSLATYYDNGGRVVIAPLANANNPVTGTFGAVANGYILIDPTKSGMFDNADTLVKVDAQHVLFTGVNAITASFNRSAGGVVNGGTVVGKWTNGGAPMVVTGVVKGRNRVDLNFYPPQMNGPNGSWAGDGTNLLRNALLYK
jgi:hypothetical protein